MPRIFSPNIDGASTELEVWDGAKLKVMVEIIGVDNNLTLELAVVLVYTFEVLDISTNSVLSDEENETKTIKTNRFAENIRDFEKGKGVTTDEIIDITKEITLEPKSVLILELS